MFCFFVFVYFSFGNIYEIIGIMEHLKMHSIYFSSSGRYSGLQILRAFTTNMCLCQMLFYCFNLSKCGHFYLFIYGGCLVVYCYHFGLIKYQEKVWLLFVSFSYANSTVVPMPLGNVRIHIFFPLLRISFGDIPPCFNSKPRRRQVETTPLS